MSVGSKPSSSKEKFALLVQPLLDSLYRTAFRMVEERLVAEELVQEACLKAYAKFDRYEEGTNFKAWIFRILANLCVDHIRRRGVAAFVPIEAVPEATSATALPIDSRTPEVLAIGRDVESVVANAFSELSPELRVVVMLVLVEEMSYAEAADSLDLPVGTVRSRLHRARGELQRRLGSVVGKRSDKSKCRNVSSVVMLFA